MAEISSWDAEAKMERHASSHPAVSREVSLASIAISAKRIADTLEAIEMTLRGNGMKDAR